MAKLYFRYSAMNAGKSTALLQVAHNYEEQGRRVAVMTAALDDRGGAGRVASRLGLTRPADTFTPETDFTATVAAWRDVGVACLLVDEAQFMTPAQVDQLHRAVHRFGVPAICYGLRSDFQGKAFPGAAALLTLADDLEEMKTICACGRKASMNVRTDGHGRRVYDGDQVQIGGNATYRSACPQCFYGERDAASSGHG